MANRLAWPDATLTSFERVARKRARHARFRNARFDLLKLTIASAVALIAALLICLLFDIRPAEALPAAAMMPFLSPV